MKVIDCNNLTKTFGHDRGLNGATFAIFENKMIGLIGRNGAGKTTLLKLIAGFTKESSGDIQVFDQKPFNSLLVSANTVFIDDQLSLPNSLNLKEILQESARFFPNWNQKLAEGLFDYFSFTPTDRHHNLSKGMKSTFNMIIGLASRSALTIFDEPTTGMDAAVRKDFYRALLKDYIRYPRTIILSSHLLNELEDILEEVLLLKDGKVLLHETMTDLKEYAIALKGPTETLCRWTQNVDILHEGTVGANTAYQVVENKWNESEQQQMKKEGIDIVKINANELCIYLTEHRRGGIDHVFN
ncbi:ABC transporter ATP-binding protein [Cytobacillus spongiae]|uniref:ATP-binding cassette domain-containing protein n=1 Tax=Cytobacillus spongiae TaxID=2901381 RepID=UPI001F463D46|nr:ABC transporter ATP-binding protein [Cytobacillus spongiae]UII56935.1 ABC transporter ATP-binding protein [Cytobacillus spongiae]